MNCEHTSLGELLKTALGPGEEWPDNVTPLRKHEPAPAPPDPRDPAPAQPWPDAAVRLLGIAEGAERRIAALEARVLELEARISTHH